MYACVFRKLKRDNIETIKANKFVTAAPAVACNCEYRARNVSCFIFDVDFASGGGGGGI